MNSNRIQYFFKRETKANNPTVLQTPIPSATDGMRDGEQRLGTSEIVVTSWVRKVSIFMYTMWRCPAGEVDEGDSRSVNWCDPTRFHRAIRFLTGPVILPN